MMHPLGGCRSRTITTRRLKRTLLLAISMIMFAVSTAAAQSFRATLTSEKVAYAATDAIELSLTIRNMSSGELALLSWKLPFAGIEDDIFVVTCGGKRAPYLGRKYKRAAPTPADWIRIAPGTEVSGSFDLSGSYAIDEGGDCTIQFQFRLANVNARGRDTLAGTVSSESLFLILDPRPRQTDEVIDVPLDGRTVIREWRANTPEAQEAAQQERLEKEAAQQELLTLLLEEETGTNPPDQPLTPSPEEEADAAADLLALSLEEPFSEELIDEAVEPWSDGIAGLESLTQVPSYRSCSADRKTKLATALESARKYAEEAYNFLRNNPYRTSRYTRWFGRFTLTRHSFVKGHFSRMKSAMRSKTFTFDCRCSTPGVFAYVYPSRPYQVWICPEFWRARNTGRDSKAGTLVHETSHFNNIGDTDDWVYDVTASRWLALYYPDYAIRNADNHAYFVELK